MAWFTIEDIYDDIAKGASLDRIHRTYGGEELYIPARRPDYKERIVEEFTGYNYAALAHTYNTSECHVRRIITEAAEETRPATPSLFEGGSA